MPNQQSNLEQQFNQAPQSISSPPQKPKFNLKYILIVLVLATLVGGGILAYQYWWLPKQETRPPEITIIDQTADWQAYRNEKYGYEFKYLQDIELIEPGMAYYPANEESSNIVLVKKNTNEEISLVSVPSITEEEASLSLNDFVNKVAEGYDKKEDLIIAGEQAVKLTFGKWEEGKNQGIDLVEYSSITSNEIIIFLKHNQIFIMLDSLDKKNEMIFNQILSTFKFIK